MWTSLRSGAWLTLDRILAVSRVVLVIQALALAALFGTSDGRVDRFDRPIGTDFSQIWVAGVFTLEGHPEKPFDNMAHLRRQQDFFTETSGFFAWGYPPMLLALAALFALMPYWLALLVWQASTLPLYLVAIWRILPLRGVLLAALAFPAVFVNIGHGHNGFLTAGLFAGGLLLLGARPVLAGICFGLLAYKPQFGLLLPLALLAGGHWRAILSAVFTTLVTAGATVAAWGVAPWSGFRDMMTFSRVELLEQGSTGFHKIQTMFAMVRLNGGSVEAAYVAQGLLLAALAAATVAVWRSAADWRLKAAQLLSGSLLATPYCLDYDMVVAGPAIALLAAFGLERGFRGWDKTILAFAWGAPLVSRGFAEATGVSLGLLALLALFALATARALRDARGAAAPAGGMRREAGGFAAAGGVGFIVDAGGTAALVALGAPPLAARAPAILAALFVTWRINRRLAFAPSQRGAAAEFLRYVIVSLAGAGVNLAVFAAAEFALARAGFSGAAFAFLCVAAGSAAAMAFNFLGYRGFAFAPAR